MACKCVCKNECVCPPIPGSIANGGGATTSKGDEAGKKSLMDSLKDKLSDPRIATATGFLGTSAMFFAAGGSKKWYILAILILIILICSFVIYWFYIRTPSDAELKLMSVTSSLQGGIGGLTSQLKDGLSGKLPGGLSSLTSKLPGGLSGLTSKLSSLK